MLRPLRCRISLLSLLRSVLRPPVTRRYPEESPLLKRGDRGTPRLVPERCTVERQCVDSCPTGAISVAPTGAEEYTWQLDYALCIFCGHCLDACPSDAIVATGEFELAGRRRQDVIAVHTVKQANRG